MSGKPVLLLRGLLLATALGVVAGCGGNGQDSPDLSNDTQEIRIQIDDMPGTLDPSLVSFLTEISVSNQLFRGLLWYDKNLELIPMAAEVVPTAHNGGITNGGLVYTFKLRDDLKWSDGVPLTAHDFEYSFKRLLDPVTAAPFASTMFNITGAKKLATASPDADPSELESLRDALGVRAADDHTLIITLERPQADFLLQLVNPNAVPLRQDLIEKYGDDWLAPEHLVGNGPFILSEVVPDSYIVLKRNPNWWMEPARLDTVKLEVASDEIAAFNSYLAGDLDVIAQPHDEKTIAVVDGDPQLREQSITLTQLTSVALAMNNTRAPFDNEEVRKAFAMAIDRAALIDAFQPGGVEVTYSWLPDGMPGFDEKLGKEWAYNPAEAKKHLEAAGYPDGNGLPEIVFAYPGNQAALAEALQEQVKNSLGVEIRLQQIDVDESRTRFQSGDYQIVSWGWGATIPDPGSMLVDPFGCQRYEGDTCTEFSNANRSYYANPEFDTIIAKATKEVDEKRRLQLYEQAHELMVQDAPVVFLGTLVQRYLVKPFVKDLVPTSLDQVFPGSYFLEKTYINGRSEVQ